ncbi:disabled homolog 2-like [Biomphalaria glabrata]|uniref:Disabled homolog 2-like n=1 Tax=Biomphalaria glabrata TaxID=6526 RepID=A0A9W3AD14_BIOGL|nr:disabled homolog 2-like [Biomphalaria glabrata]
MAARGKKVVNPNDPARFSGNGLNYRAKLIGIENVPEARGDEMCQEAITKLKNSVKISGQHKPKIFVQVTLEGLKIIDAISLTANQSKKKSDSKSPKQGEMNEQEDKTKELIVLHTHAVHRISFIARDVTDNRAFGYVYGEGDGTHKFFAIKTAAAAEQLVLALRDLFQVVYEMKKKEMEKIGQDGSASDETTKVENSQTSGDGSTSGTGQAPVEKVNADGENIYQVPTNNAPVNPPTQAEQVANLLDLEDQADHILKDIEQIKNLEFDSLTSDSLFSPASPPVTEMASLAISSSVGTASIVDPWGLSPSVSPPTAAPAIPASSSSSALGDLAGLQTGQFAPMGQTSFPPSPFSVQPGLLGAPNMNMMSGNLPVNRDPFGNDPFSSSTQQRLQQSPGFGAATNPFGAGGFGSPFGLPQAATSPMGLMPGMVPHGFMPQAGIVGSGVPQMAIGGVRNPFGASLFPSPQPQMTNLFNDDEVSVLKPIKKDALADAQNAESAQAKPKSTRDDLFGDLLDIKKSTPPVAASLSPKDLFNQATPVEKKSLNELKSVSKPTQAPQVQASADFDYHFPGDEANDLPFTDLEEEDCLASSYGPPAMDPPSCPKQLLSNPLVSPTPPPVPQRNPSPSFFSENCLSSESKLQTAFVLNSPPVPSRTINHSNHSKPFPALVLNTSSDKIFSHLPSPDEPPPPLPLQVASEFAAPTPPPRPIFSSSSSSFSSSPSPIPDVSINKMTLKSISSTVTLDCIRAVPNKEVASLSSNNINSDNFTCDITNASQSDIKPREFPTCMFSDQWDNMQKPFPTQEDGYSSKTGDDPFMAANKSDDWRSCDLTDNDPFNMPLHLTPGFKAVAKFGNDPFDDSFNALKNDNWDPFALSVQETFLEPNDVSVLPVFHSVNTGFLLGTKSPSPDFDPFNTATTSSNKCPTPAFDPFTADFSSGNTNPLPTLNAFGVPTQAPSAPASGNSLLD